MLLWWYWLAGGLYLALPTARAQPTTDSFDALKVSAEIADYLARRDLDAAASAAAKLMVSTSPDKLKDVFRLVTNLGKSQYTDLVYTRDYGRTEKDIIYKIDFDEALLYVRILYYIDGGKWRLAHLRLKTENHLPFPKEWVHIYPK